MAVAARGRRKRERRPEIKLMFIDVRKAHLNARCEEDVYVELPEEFGVGRGVCGKLRRWLYGMRKAAAGWEDHYAEKLEEVGFVRGSAAPTVFFNKATGVRVVVHGDDFTFSGVKEELVKLQILMEEWYEIKFRGIMGSGLEDIKEVVILGRLLRWTDEGLEYEADGKHREELMKAMGMDKKANTVVSPAVRDEFEDEEDETQLEPEDTRKFRPSAARLNYLALDRSDIQFAMKEVCTCMSKPSIRGMKRLKRAV